MNWCNEKDFTEIYFMVMASVRRHGIVYCDILDYDPTISKSKLKSKSFLLCDSHNYTVQSDEKFKRNPIVGATKLNSYHGIEIPLLENLLTIRIT